MSNNALKFLIKYVNKEELVELSKKLEEKDLDSVYNYVMNVVNKENWMKVAKDENNSFYIVIPEEKILEFFKYIRNR